MMRAKKLGIAIVSAFVVALQLIHLAQVPKTLFKGVDGAGANKEIRLGTSVPISGSLYKLGIDLTKGMGIVFNRLNQSGGIDKHLIKLIVRDDAYEKSEMKKNIDVLSADTSILFGTFSSDALDVIPKEKLNDYLAIFPLAGVSDFRKPECKSAFFFRPSTADEVRTLINYATSVLYKRKIAIFYEDSLWGRDGVKIAKEYITSLGNSKAEFAAAAAYVRNSVNVAEAADILSKSSPEVVICIAIYWPAYNFIKAMLNKGQEKITYMGVSDVALIQDYLEKSRGVSLITTSIVPNPWTSKLQIAKDYRDAMKQYLPNYRLSLISFEGYICATLLEERLKKIVPPITKEKIITSIEECKNIDFKGIPINFNPLTRTLLHKLWLNVGEELEWKMVDVKEAGAGK